MKRVAVTGMGIIDPLGSNPNDCYTNLVSKDYTAPQPYQSSKLERWKSQNVFHVDQEKVVLPDNIKPSLIRSVERAIRYSLHAVNQALEDAGVPETDNVAVVASNITAGNELKMEVVPKLFSEDKKVRPMQLLGSTKDFLCGFISQHYGFHGPNASMYAACATSLFSIDYAMSFVDDYDYVVCTVADGGINETDIGFFSMINALGTHSAPFDDNRDGFIMGEGGACLILESEEKAKARGATIHAYLYPVGFGSDAFNVTSPDPEGLGAKQAMNNALKGIDVNDIGFVNAHGTSTPVGDEIEYRAVTDVLGKVPMFSSKSKIGHTMGACGMIEAIHSIQTLKNGSIPDNFNINNCSFDSYGLITDQNRTTHSRMCINNSFGFGGKCASQVIEVNDG